MSTLVVCDPNEGDGRGNKEHCNVVWTVPCNKYVNNWTPKVVQALMHVGNYTSMVAC